MTKEQKSSKSFEERIASCPIHQTVDVNGYISRFQIPEHVQRVFHELILARGEYPKYMTQEQGKKFSRQAASLVREYEVSEQDGEPLRMMFAQLIEFWLGQGAQFN